VVIGPDGHPHMVPLKFRLDGDDIVANSNLVLIRLRKNPCREEDAPSIHRKILFLYIKTNSLSLAFRLLLRTFLKPF